MYWACSHENLKNNPSRLDPCNLNTLLLCFIWKEKTYYMYLVESIQRQQNQKDLCLPLGHTHNTFKECLFNIYIYKILFAKVLYCRRNHILGALYYLNTIKLPLCWFTHRQYFWRLIELHVHVLQIYCHSYKCM